MPFQGATEAHRGVSFFFQILVELACCLLLAGCLLARHGSSNHPNNWTHWQKYYLLQLRDPGPNLQSHHPHMHVTLHVVQEYHVIPHHPLRLTLEPGRGKQTHSKVQTDGNNHAQTRQQVQIHMGQCKTDARPIKKKVSGSVVRAAI